MGVDAPTTRTWEIVAVGVARLEDVLDGELVSNGRFGVWTANP
jgi:hypothetical protein